MQREIRRALPNSVRVTNGGTALELIPVIDGGRYRESPPGNNNARLNFSTADTDFDMLGNLLCTTNPDITGPCTDYANLRIVIYNLGQTGADAYAGTDVITPAGLTMTSNGAADGTSDHIRIDAGFDFAFESPNQRFFVVQGPVSYICNAAARTLTRYQGYPLTAAQANIDTDAELSALVAGAMVADRTTAPCRFGYTPGTDTRSGVVTIEIALLDPATNESVRLLHQVHVDNAP
jgi:MSHA biogenesis protein MshO